MKKAWLVIAFNNSDKQEHHLWIEAATEEQI